MGKIFLNIKKKPKHLSKRERAHMLLDMQVCSEHYLTENGRLGASFVLRLFRHLQTSISRNI